MARRPYKDLTGSELTKTLSEQLARPEGSALPMIARAQQSSYFTQPSPLWSQTVTTSSTPLQFVDYVTYSNSGTNVETVFRVGTDGRPEAVTRLVDQPAPTSVRNAGETDMAWLRRRVNEISSYARL